jgi:hypothetical protein
MSMRIALAAVLLTAGSSSLAIAQSTTATSGTTKPMMSAPASNSMMPNGQPKWQAPPAARAGEKGLAVGEGAFNGAPVEIKRNK